MPRVMNHMYLIINLCYLLLKKKLLMIFFEFGGRCGQLVNYHLRVLVLWSYHVILIDPARNTV